MNIEWNNLDQSESFKKLQQFTKPVNLEKDITAERVKTWKVPLGKALTFYYGAAAVNPQILSILQALADEQQLGQKYSALLAGEYVNTGENRRVLHHLSRSIIDNAAQDYGDFYREQNKRIREFSQKVHNGEIRGSTGKRFSTVVQIGIGGSDLGPRALYLALKGAHSVQMGAHFVSNVDPDDAAEIISLINPESTLFILVSKSGTTQETLANRDLIIKSLGRRNIPGYDASKHLLAVTSRMSPLAGSSEVLESFYIDDYIGGRYSSTSAVGGVLLSLCFGADVFDKLLKGASEVDRAALEPDILHNAAMLDALIGVYYRNVLDWPCTAILPYSQALSRFPAHLQQLDMESNGKSVNRYGKALSYSTGPIVFGEPGTNGQHSFYQLLHQGTDITPLQFVGFQESQYVEDNLSGDSSSQDKLKANLAAQIIAFAKGKKDGDANKNFDGGRPSTVLIGRKLDAFSLGALLGHYENKVMFQGFCWNINSFDQEGVQLGKVLAQSVLDGSYGGDESLKAWAECLEIGVS